MAGETALSAWSSVGVYILEDNNSWVTNNTPNTCEIGGDNGLAVGVSYMYFDIFVSLSEATLTPRTEDITGWRFWQSATVLNKTSASTGQGQQRSFLLQVHVTSTQQQNFEKFFDFHQSITGTGAHQLYLVRQWASTTFKNFSYNATLYNYTPVVVTGYELAETGSPGKELQLLTIQMRQADRVTTS